MSIRSPSQAAFQRTIDRKTCRNRKLVVSQSAIAGCRTIRRAPAHAPKRLSQVARAAHGAVPIVRPHDGEVDMLKKLFKLNKLLSQGETTKLEELVQNSGLALVSTSATAQTTAYQSMTDTFDDYEDMQGVPIAALQNQNMMSATASVDEASLRQGWPSTPPYATDSVDPAWDDRIPADASVDGHCLDIDMFGDGGAVGTPTGQGRGTSPAAAALSQAASKVSSVAGSAAKVTGKAASSAYAQVSSLISGNKLAAAAIAALSHSSERSQWAVLDDASDAMRIIVLTASADVKQAMQNRVTGMVPFEGRQQVKISSRVQLEARELFMQLVPIITEATDSGMLVCLTGLGPGGSLASVLALMCAHQLGSSSLEAVVFDARPCIAEEAKDVGSSAQDEREVVDNILSHGLISDMGLPASIIKNVMVHSGSSLQPAAAKPAAAASSDLVSTLSSLAAKAVPSLGLVEDADQVSMTVHNNRDGKTVTVYKPMGTVMMLEV